MGKKMEMLSTEEYINLRREAFRNDNVTPSAIPGNVGYAPDLLLWDTTRYTDLHKLLMGESAQTLNTSINISGGNSKTQFALGGTFNKESTIFIGDSKYRRGTVNFSVNHRALKDKLNLAISANYSLESNNLFNGSALYYSNLPPNLPNLYDSDIKLNWSENGAAFFNPVAFTKKEYRSYRKNLISRLQISYSILDNLSLKTALGYNDIRADERSLDPLATQDPQSDNYEGFALYSTNSFSSWIIEPQIDYLLKLKAGVFNITAGSTLQSTLNETQSIRASGYTNDQLLKSLSAATTLSNASNRYEPYKYMAAFARINYNFENKYLLNLSGRRDGSSRFGLDNRWGNFFAFGAAWVFTNEKFISSSRNNALSFGKLRMSYGTSGNDQIGNYQYLDTWQTWRPYQGSISLFPSSLYNPNYGWEVNKKYEIAIETVWLRERIFFNLAYFSNRSGNQLIQYILPSQTGHFSINRNFPALIENSGWESQLSFIVVDGKSWKWESGCNITVPKNRLVEFDNLENSAYRSQYVIGKSLNIIYGYKSLGVNPQTGVYEFQDTNQDGTLNTTDFVDAGNLDPQYYGGWNNTIRFKGFSLNTFFQYKKQLGTTILNSIYYTPQSFPGLMFNQPSVVMQRWNQPGDITAIQKVSATTTSEAYRAANNYLKQSDAVMGDASFIRLKTIELSYNLPKEFIRHIAAQSCNIFFQGQNLLTITNYNGWDPETQGNPLAIPH
ncbi:SusC/RagA family TonB-linked outer membrane protein [Niabella sp. W65]|nr:SusC/RagA family TonB-linked outer membrane protein [Niabella sp. W65]MCH7364086.1 SusC/RagA family TonB-linked outer membrane protein [Niabella sp. W65]ULT46487.1 SusC/RagA family TonB-linked outer membrane protein [Niabella sp. I65]